MSGPADPSNSSTEPLLENPSSSPGLIDLARFTREDIASSSSSTDETGDIAAPGCLIGRYELKQLLGEGGFGTVWKALQWEPIRREVVLKVVRPGMDSREIISRFETERQSLALMDHPNIAAVFDAGSTTAGRPYFVMELVQGLPITTYCDQRQLSIEQRLELFIPVCQAVQHAHQKAILHRDLKPSNILVADLDGRPAPKVIDFGIAKALGGPADEAGSPLRPLRSHGGMIIGTPQYMSPEQAGSLPDVDTRSDIYTLGVILYELLTGRVPLQEDSARPHGFEELLRCVREQAPPRPSQVLLSPAQQEETTPAATARRLDKTRLARRLRGDLDWVVMKALEKDRNRRYESAASLAQDIRRHLRQEPVSAATPTWSYEASKFVRRHRTIVTAGATVAAALVAATFISYTQAARAIQAGKETQKALDQSRKSQADAHANLARAREAVDQFLNKVTNDRRLSQANLQSLRQQLLETALPFYQQFVAQQSNDPAVRMEQAGAYLRLGMISFVIGDTTQAETSLRTAISWLAQLPEAERTAPKARQIEAKSLQVLTWLWQYKKHRPGTLPADALGAEEILFTADLQGVPSLVAAPEPKPPAPAPAAAAPTAAQAQPGDRIPRRFTYDYKFTDPGVRTWVREGNIWTETQPSGRQNVLSVIGRITVEGVEGSLLGRSDVPGLQVFVPDRSTPDKMRLKVRNSKDAPWHLLGILQDVE